MACICRGNATYIRQHSEFAVDEDSLWYKACEVVSSVNVRCNTSVSVHSKIYLNKKNNGDQLQITITVTGYQICLNLLT